MGEYLVAWCDECKFGKRNIEFGGGRYSFKTWMPVPGINKETGEFVTENYHDKEKLKEKITFYNERGMYEGEDDGWGHRCFNVVIKREKNKCPKCGKFTLQFGSIGMFD